MNGKKAKALRKQALKANQNPLDYTTDSTTIRTKHFPSGKPYVTGTVLLNPNCNKKHYRNLKRP